MIRYSEVHWSTVKYVKVLLTMRQSRSSRPFSRILNRISSESDTIWQNLIMLYAGSIASDRMLSVEPVGSKIFWTQTRLGWSIHCNSWLCKISDKIFQFDSVIATEKRNLVLIFCVRWVVDTFENSILIL